MSDDATHRRTLPDPVAAYQRHTHPTLDSGNPRGRTSAAAGWPSSQDNLGHPAIPSDEPTAGETKRPRSEDTAPQPTDARCQPHDNRPPCPSCLAEMYGIYVWNNL